MRIEASERQLELIRYLISVASASPNIKITLLEIDYLINKGCINIKRLNDLERVRMEEFLEALQIACVLFKAEDK